jgi:hypothetical protein
VEGQKGGIGHPIAIGIPRVDADGSRRSLAGLQKAQSPAGRRSIAAGVKGQGAESGRLDQAGPARSVAPSSVGVLVASDEIEGFEKRGIRHQSSLIIIRRSPGPV